MPEPAHPTEAGRAVAVVQARMSSSRLPGKVLRPLAGRPVLDWVLAAAAAAREVDTVLLATSTDPSDDPVADAGEAAGVAVVRGSLDDVLGRFLAALDADDRAAGSPAAALVRLTADCPLLDPALIDLVVRTWRAWPGLDHLTTTNPRCLPRGLDVEVVSTAALRDVGESATGPDRVHVTSAVYRDADRFVVGGLVVHPDTSDLRVTLDTPEDARLLDLLVAELASRGDPPYPYRDVVAVLRTRPDLVALNREVRQKQWHEG